MRTRYEFRVSGRLSPGVAATVRDFGDLRIVAAQPDTVLYAVVTDQARLSSILVFLENMGLRVRSVHQLPDGTGGEGTRS